MLDQNTDRMWYVIGAVIVGAAIIFLVNSSFPQLFASIGDTFTSKSDETNEQVAKLGVNENVIDPLAVRFDESNTRDVAYTDSSNTWVFTATPSPVDGDGISRLVWPSDYSLLVSHGLSYTLSYELYTPKELQWRHDINTKVVAEDGSILDNWNGNNNDEVSNRTINGLRDVTNTTKDYLPIITIPKNSWTRIYVTYSNTASLNVDKSTLLEGTSIGFVNGALTDSFDMKIRNIKGEYTDRVTPFVKYEK